MTRIATDATAAFFLNPPNYLFRKTTEEKDMGKPLGYYSIEATAEDEAEFEKLTPSQLIAVLKEVVDELADKLDCDETCRFLEECNMGGEALDLAKAVINRLEEVKP
jgi:hypothetical protein